SPPFPHNPSAGSPGSYPSPSVCWGEGISASPPVLSPGCSEQGWGATLLTVSLPELPFDWLLSPMNSGAVSGAAGCEWGALALSGAGDLRGGGCIFHQGGMGSAGPPSKSPLQRRYAGEL
uniref:Uncharacterized protein n=1 Tax=Chelonoidis abingdonii TaxID=106734 RepID=A0A8C0J8Y9_CHEAB